MNDKPTEPPVHASADCPLTVLVVTWNARDLLERCVRSVLPQLEPGDVLRVVDNGSEDDSRTWLSAQAPQVERIDLPRNLGFAGGCDEGLVGLRTPWVFTLNNDAYLEPDALGRLRARAIAAEANVGAIQPLVLFDVDPPRIQSTGIVLHTSGHAMDRHFGEPASHGESAAEPFGPTAGAALWRTAMLDALRLPSGCLDRRFFMYFEDVDLGWRARLAGWRTIYVADALVRHRWQGTSRRHGRYFVELHCTLNRVRTLAKNASFSFWARSARRTAGDYIWLSRRQGGQALRLWLRALLDGMRDRWAVGRRARVGRRAVERRWVVAPAEAAPETPPASNAVGPESR